MSSNGKEGGLRLVDDVLHSGEQIVLITANDTAPTGRGDPVQMYAAGYSNITTSPYNCNQVQRGTATSAVYGVVNSFDPWMNDGTGTMNLSQTYRSASTAEYCKIKLGNNLDVYEMTDDGATPGLASGHGFYNYKFVAANCDSVYGLSKFTIDSANGATTATFPVKVIGPSNDPSNNPAAASASWRCLLNNVVASGGTGTAGV